MSCRSSTLVNSLRNNPITQEQWVNLSSVQRLYYEAFDADDYYVISHGPPVTVGMETNIVAWPLGQKYRHVQETASRHSWAGLTMSVAAERTSLLGARQHLSVRSQQQPASCGQRSRSSLRLITRHPFARRRTPHAAAYGELSAIISTRSVTPASLL